MQNDPRERLVSWLRSHPGAWSSSQLAAALGVTDRSIRNYIRDLNAAHDGVLIERTTKGYRLNAAAPGGAPVWTAGTSAARERHYAILRRILTSSAAVSIFDLAAEVGTSESSLEKDLRLLAKEAGRYRVNIVKRAHLVTVQGRESDQRALMRQAVIDAADPRGMLATDKLQAAYESYDIADIKRHVAQSLAANGLHSNDYALNPLILELVIAVDRITDDYAIDESPSGTSARSDPRLAGATQAITRYFTDAYGVQFSPPEAEALALLIASRTTLLRGTTDRDVVVSHVGLELVSVVRTILTRLDDTYLVQLADDAFVASLALHTHNLLLRAKAGHPQHNPLAAAIRAGHPLVHELAVFFTSELEHATGVVVDPDEVGFIALHLGSALNRGRDSDDRVTLTLVAPGYHGISQHIARRLSAQLGDRAVLTQVIESSEPRAEEVIGELVVGPIAVPGIHPTRQILTGPLLSQADIDLVDVEVRAHQRRNAWIRLMGQLQELFDRSLFYVSPNVTGRDNLLGVLCAALERRHAVPSDFLQQVLERENLSPTAFNDIVAIPHTLGMPATNTSIAVATFDEAIEWGDTTVRLVLLVAFSSEDRNLFRDTFDQLVMALAESRNVQRLVERGRTFDDFVAELSQLMEE